MGELTNRQKISLMGAIIYTAIIGVGMFISFHIRGISYESPKIMDTLWVVEVILALWVIFLTVKYFSWKEVGFVKLDKKQTAWLLPSFIILIVMLVAGFYAFCTRALSPEKIEQAGLIAFTTFFVGFSEELMYRGILLNTFLKTHRPTKAILISAAAFSFLHTVNMLGGLAFHFMLMQLLLTFLFGLFAALIFMRIRNIIPLILFHWLWDFAVISNGVIDGQSLIARVASVHFLVEFIIIVVLYLRLNKIDFEKEL